MVVSPVVSPPLEMTLKKGSRRKGHAAASQSSKMSKVSFGVAPAGRQHGTGAPVPRAHLPGSGGGRVRVTTIPKKGSPHNDNQPSVSWRAHAFADIISDEAEAAREASMLLLRQMDKQVKGDGGGGASGAGGVGAKLNGAAVSGAVARGGGRGGGSALRGAGLGEGGGEFKSQASDALPPYSAAVRGSPRSSHASPSTHGSHAPSRAPSHSPSHTPSVGSGYYKRADSQRTAGSRRVPAHIAAAYTSKTAPQQQPASKRSRTMR